MDEQTARIRLLARLTELAEEDRISEAGRAPVQLDQESVGRLPRIDAMQLQAMALAAKRRRSAERQRVHAALRRIDEGEYGYCTRCGEGIAERRLERDPAASLCIACASEQS